MSKIFGFLLMFSFLMIGQTGCFYDNNSVQPSISLKSKESPQSSSHQQKRDKLLVKFKNGTDENEKKSIRKLVAATKLEEYKGLGMELWKVNSKIVPNAIKLIEKQKNVEFVEINKESFQEVHNHEK